MKRSPVYITGVGAATPLGCSFEEIADNLLKGVSGVRRVTDFPVADHPSQIGAALAEIPCPADLDAGAFRAKHRPDQLARWCCGAALQDAGLWERRQGLRIGLVLGTAAEWNAIWENDAAQGGRAIEAPALPASMTQRMQRELELTGPTVSLSAACASSNFAISIARRWLELGWVDACLAGGCDLAVTPMTLAGFGNLRALSRRNEEPARASRPFDKERDGFVLGEGGTVFVLERGDRARRRDARLYAEVAGCGASSDAYHMVIPSPEPEPAADAMRRALADAHVDPADVDYVNAHATSTPVGDSAEANVLRLVFGDAVQRIPVSSTKSMTGHLLTAAAAFEALACIVAMQRRAVPPTINLDDPDPECSLCHVPNTAREHRVRIAVSNSFGFGGSNTTLVLKAA